MCVCINVSLKTNFKHIKLQNNKVILRILITKKEKY